MFPRTAIVQINLIFDDFRFLLRQKTQTIFLILLLFKVTLFII